ncbi:MAG: hypothetical protein M3Y35_10175 [Actinomycetota bacterium]|nr:hypothetical protein [Actinomycetota bacterium]
MAATKWVARQDDNPVKRISFGGDREAAESFAAQLDGWSVISDEHPEWLPLLAPVDHSDRS